MADQTPPQSPDQGDAELSDFQQVRQMLLNMVENLTLNGGLNNAEIAKVHFDGTTEQIIAWRDRNAATQSKGDSEDERD